MRDSRGRRLGWLVILLPTMANAGCGGTKARKEQEPTVEPPGCGTDLAFSTPSGECVRPGIAEEDCAEGFTHDGSYGCEPVMADDCPPGTMSVPGDEACRPPMPCGEGRWDGIAVEPNTQHVDGSYLGSDADGTAERPWPTIGEALDAAAPGASVVVAAGSYAENLYLSNKPVRLRGVCPERVELVATSAATGPCPPTAACIGPGADGSELSGFTIRGGFWGTSVSGAQDVLLEGLRIIGNANGAIVAANALGPTSLTIRRVLIEEATDSGLYFNGVEGLVESTEVRGTLPDPATQQNGIGLLAESPCLVIGDQPSCDPANRGSVEVYGSVFDRSTFAGVATYGEAVAMDGSVIRRTSPSAVDQRFGVGVLTQVFCQTPQDCDLTARGSLRLSRSLVTENYQAGVMLVGADATIESAVIQDTQARADSGVRGNGIQATSVCVEGAICFPDTATNVEVTRSLLRRNHASNIAVVGSRALVESSVIHEGRPRPSDGRGGSGLQVQPVCTQDGQCDPQFPSAATVRDSLFADNSDVSIIGLHAKVELVSSLVERTLSRADGKFGDGVVIVGNSASGASGSLADLRVEESARAAVAAFGAQLQIQSSHLRCAAFELTSGPFEDAQSSVENAGGNACGCPIADGPCKITTPALEPPGASSEP